MTACAGRLAVPDGLACTRTDDHQPGHGCVYESTSGVPDRHDTGEADE